LKIKIGILDFAVHGWVIQGRKTFCIEYEKGDLEKKHNSFQIDGIPAPEKHVNYN
jgi:hypothetical protein